MTSQTKIVGISRGEAEAVEHDETLELGAAEEESPQAEPATQEPWVEETNDWSAEADYDYSYEEAPRRWPAIALMASLALAGIGWTGFFLWANMAALSSDASASAIASLITGWSVPVLLLGVIWLLFMRNSRAEAMRFSDAGAALRKESEALEIRMRTVNEEITLARNFLSQNAQELDSVGRQAAGKMVEAAEQLRIALADSDQKAQQLEEVSNAANSNLEQLRKHLPVVTSAAKDVTNQIGSAGNNAQLQVKSLIAALQHVSTASDNARNSVAELDSTSNDAAAKIADQFARLTSAMTETLGDAEARSTSLVAQLDGSTQHARQQLAASAAEMQTVLAEIEAGFSHNVNEMQSLFAATTKQGAEALENRVEKLSSKMETQRAQMDEQLAKMDEGLTQIAATFGKHDADMDQLIVRVSNLIDDSRKRISLLDEEATEHTTRLAFAFETLVESTQNIDKALGGTNSNAATLLKDAQTLNSTLSEIQTQVDDRIPQMLERMDAKFVNQLERIGASRDTVQELDSSSTAMLDRLAEIDTRIAAQHKNLEGLLATSDEQLASYHERSEELKQSLASTREVIEQLSAGASEKLLVNLQSIGAESRKAAEDSRQIIEGELASIGSRLSEESENALQQAVTKQLEAVRGAVSNAIERQLGGSQLAVQKMTQQLAKLDEMAANLELRLKDTHDGFGGMDDENFARRMALLTESLNSTAIDVAKILSNEVTDTAWASYLKGDRGVFTRRAVRLLDSGEARAIAQHYDEDAEFREHVNRYIHDFEAMMRVLLSTRDGNAVGVTVLSSDVGKLYVALAQAIERLRS